MKSLLLISAILLAMTLCSCGNTVTNTATTDPGVVEKEYDIEKEYYIEKDGVFECIEDGSKLTLKLPNSTGKATVNVEEEVKDYLSLIDRDLYNMAIADFFNQIKTSGGVMKNYPYISITKNEDNYLSLIMECIVDYDPPHTQVYEGEVISGGCGIDHDHIHVWYTPISNSKIK